MISVGDVVPWEHLVLVHRNMTTQYNTVLSVKATKRDLGFVCLFVFFVLILIL